MVSYKPHVNFVKRGAAPFLLNLECIPHRSVGMGSKLGFSKEERFFEQPRSEPDSFVQEYWCTAEPTVAHSLLEERPVQSGSMDWRFRNNISLRRQFVAAAWV